MTRWIAWTVCVVAAVAWACGGDKKNTMCTNTCTTPSNRICEDGGNMTTHGGMANSISAACQLGTDCNDCGTRTIPTAATGLCTETCLTPRNGSCDDGGTIAANGGTLNATGATCQLGTDCTDCGMRNSPTAATGMCLNTCTTRSNGFCDDGGTIAANGGTLDATGATCQLGTDCADCGMRNSPTTATGMCLNTCTTRSNGFCDDGGTIAANGGTLDATGATCQLGTDCADCGMRTTGTTGATGGTTDPASKCENTCNTSGNTVCEDGGTNSIRSTCEIGTDCTDCGTRTTTDVATRFCTDACTSSANGVCEDGGNPATHGGNPSTGDSCKLGSDCSDCSSRMVTGGSQTQNPDQNQLCSEECRWSNDKACDDGGPGATMSICELGTDCLDCGPRPRPTTTN